MQKQYVLAIIFIIICTVFDLKKKTIPVLIIAISGMLSFGFLFIEETDWYLVMYSLIPGAVLLMLSLCTKESIGYGDGFIVLILGLLLGITKCVTVVFIGFFVFAIFALFLLLIKKVNGKSKLPYVPFLAIGLGVVLFG